MKSSVKLAVLLALLATLCFAGVAGAHTLKISRAAKANKTFTRLLCKATNDEETSCVASRPGGCRRIAMHRVRCSLFLTLESLKDKGLVRCRALIEWVQRPDGRISPHFLGIKSCLELRAPEPEPVP